MQEARTARTQLGPLGSAEARRLGFFIPPAPCKVPRNCSCPLSFPLSFPLSSPLHSLCRGLRLIPTLPSRTSRTSRPLSAPYRSAAAVSAAVRGWRWYAEGDASRFAEGASAALRSAYTQHVAAPIKTVSDELFNTFRARPGLMLTADTLNDNEEALRRMVGAFAKSVGNREAATLEEGLRVMISVYEKELEAPIRSLLAGELMRALLIQVQKLKCDGEAAMRAMDQVRGPPPRTPSVDPPRGPLRIFGPDPEHCVAPVSPPLISIPFPSHTPLQPLRPSVRGYTDPFSE